MRLPKNRVLFIVRELCHATDQQGKPCKRQNFVETSIPGIQHCISEKKKKHIKPDVLGASMSVRFWKPAKNYIGDGVFGRNL